MQGVYCHPMISPMTSSPCPPNQVKVTFHHQRCISTPILSYVTSFPCPLNQVGDTFSHPSYLLPLNDFRNNSTPCPLNQVKVNLHRPMCLLIPMISPKTPSPCALNQVSVMLPHPRLLLSPNDLLDDFLSLSIKWEPHFPTHGVYCHPTISPITSTPCRLNQVSHIPPAKLFNATHWSPRSPPFLSQKLEPHFNTQGVY